MDSINAKQVSYRQGTKVAKPLWQRGRGRTRARGGVQDIFNIFVRKCEVLTLLLYFRMTELHMRSLRARKATQ